MFLADREHEKGLQDNPLTWLSWGSAVSSCEGGALLQKGKALCAELYQHWHSFRYWHCLQACRWHKTRQDKIRNRRSSPAAASNPVIGSGTPGQITKWLGVDGSNTYSIGDTNITEDKFGKVGIGTRTPTSSLTVRGSIETTLGGFKFPDGSVQTTAIDPNQVVSSLNGLTGNLTLAGGANITITESGNTLTIAAPNALTGVAHDATLQGNGTLASPLGVAVPLNLSGYVSLS